jgi:hypothetical protein
MLTVPKMTVTRDAAWRAFRRTPDARLRERYHCLLLLIDGKSCPEIARWWYRRRTPCGAGCTPSSREGSRGWRAKRSRAGRRDSRRSNGPR